MNSNGVALLGVQHPRVRLVPRASSNDFEDAVFLSSSYGLIPDEWQENVLEGWLGLRPDGKWAAPRCGLAVPRQNGKNGVVEIRELYGLIVLGEKWLHTAHEVKTARKAFVRLLSFFENPRQYPELVALVKEIRKTNGQEAIVLTNGGSVEFVARSKGSGRGFTVDVLLMDEAQELSEDALAALLPTISAGPRQNPQQIMIGTPPGPTAVGEAFTRLRTAGVEGKDRRLCWMEWSCTPDVNLDDLGNLARSNPALGKRLMRETALDERATFDDATYGRERFGIWDEATSQVVIKPSMWAACLDPESQIKGVAHFALDVSPDRLFASIGLCGRRVDGLWHVEVLEEVHVGIEWVIPRGVELTERWPEVVISIVAGSHAESLRSKLEAAGVRTQVIPASEVATACGFFYDEVCSASPTVRHIGQKSLDVAIRSARRTVDNGETAWKWGRKRSTGDIVDLYSATLALWAAEKAGSAPINPSVFFI